MLRITLWWWSIWTEFTVIAKLASNSTMEKDLSIYYSEGSMMAGDVTEWLRYNGVIRRFCIDEIKYSI